MFKEREKREATADDYAYRLGQLRAQMQAQLGAKWSIPGGVADWEGFLLELLDVQADLNRQLDDAKGRLKGLENLTSGLLADAD